MGGFYRRIRVVGDPSTLRGRPVVIAVNHSNALGDIALLLTVLPQFPRFLAASSWWRRAPVRLLFRLGRVLPVHRRDDGPTGEQNGNTFAACHDALAAADHIAIFPEGRLNSGSELLRLRTGAARIALSAAVEEGISRVAIVPVALAYSDRGRLRSDVAIQFGVPIEIDDWVELAGADPVDAARGLTDLLQQRLADAFALGTSEIEAIAVDPTAGRHRRAAELVVLAPVAAAGVAANAATVVPIALGARFVRHEGWQATAKAVAATVLLPVSWLVAGRLLAKRWGAARAAMLVSVGAGSGWVSLAWLGRVRDLVDSGRRTAPSGDRSARSADI